MEGTDEKERFGEAISLSDDGNRLAVTSFWKKDQIDFQGCVNIFEITGSGDSRIWTKIGETIRGDSISNKSIQYGSSIDLTNDGNIIAIGHERASTQLTLSDPLIENHGSVRVY